MNVAIPPEFAVFARERVEAGVYVSEEDAVAAVLRDYLARREELAAALDEGLSSGAPVDGRALLDRIEAELEALVAERPA